MKKILSIIIIIVAISSYTPSASAYGGGGGTPPVYDNPHSPVKIECKTVKQKLPFDQEISYPKCKVVKNPEYKEYDKEFKQRLKDFLARVRKGGR